MFLFKRDIHRQLADFVSYKEARSVTAAKHHQEWLLLFLKNCKKNNVLNITEDDIEMWQEWLNTTYSSDHFYQQGIHSLRCFLRFFRCRIPAIMSTRSVGRPANQEAIKVVKDYRAKGLSFRDIQTLLKRKGWKNTDLKILHFWAHYKGREA